MGDHPATQLRRLCPGDVRASGGSVLLVPVITLCTVDLEECVRGAAETGELRMSSSSVLRQRDPELYVITKTHGYTTTPSDAKRETPHTSDAIDAHIIMIFTYIMTYIIIH